VYYTINSLYQQQGRCLFPEALFCFWGRFSIFREKEKRGQFSKIDNNIKLENCPPSKGRTSIEPVLWRLTTELVILATKKVHLKNFPIQNQYEPIKYEA
jgi:hypothetical protein